MSKLDDLEREARVNLERARRKQSPMVRKDSPPPVSKPPPIDYPTTKTERDYAELRADYADALSRIEQLEHERERVRVSLPPDSEKRARVAAVLALLKSYGGGATIIAALSTAVMAYLKPAAKPEQVEAIKTEQVQKQVVETKKESVSSTYETQLRAAYECRLAQLAHVAMRAGYELDWRTDSVIFEPNQIVRNRQGFVEEKPPFKPRRGTECPPMPTKP
jgi:hypothetical protein